MADTDSKSWTFLKGVGGVAAAVATAVLVYYLTRPAPTPPPVPTASSIELDGFVADSATHQLLRKASVTVGLGQNSVQQYTDASGRYSVVFNIPTATAAMGTVAIQAEGYQPFTNSVPLKPGDNFAEIALDAVPPPPSAQPTQPATPTVTPAATPGVPVFHPTLNKASILVRPPPADYIKMNSAKFAFIKHP